MDTDNISREFAFKDETHRIIGCAMEILNTVGHGFFEKIYENAMVIELTEHGVPFEQQKRYSMTYKGQSIGEYIPDLIAYNQIVVEIKTIDRITDHEKGQVLNYLKVSGLKVGLILNFKRSKLEWHRIVL